MAASGQSEMASAIAPLPLCAQIAWAVSTGMTSMPIYINACMTQLINAAQPDFLILGQSGWVELSGASLVCLPCSPRITS